MEFLEPAERRMLELSLSGRLTRAEAAALMGCDRGTVTRRVRSLMRRLHEPIVVALAEEGALLPELHREVGLAFFLRRESIAVIARRYGVSRYGVKRMIDTVRGWFAARKSC
jgi:DNA-binding CsgD family transcriptional regulator